MIVALVDNGSIDAAAHRHLRAVAAALSTRVDTTVHAVSWKHSDRIAPAALGGAPAWALASFVRAMVALGQREFVFVPFFISAGGAIGLALRNDLEELQRQTGGFEFSFTAGLAAQDAIPAIAAARIRETITAQSLRTPPVIVVDHGGPSAASAALRDELAARILVLLGDEIGPLAATSMEGTHGPLLSDQLTVPGFNRGDVVVAPLFLAPGRHAGPEGDVAQICRAAPGRCHRTRLVGNHPAVVEVLTAILSHALGERRQAAIPMEAGAYVS